LRRRQRKLFQQPWVDDAYFANTLATPATGLQLPTAWNIWAAIQHYWVPELRTSLYGGYGQYKANSTAIDANICAALLCRRGE